MGKISDKKKKVVTPLGRQAGALLLAKLEKILKPVQKKLTPLHGRGKETACSLNNMSDTFLSRLRFTKGWMCAGWASSTPRTQPDNRNSSDL
jgi:hypothetical protein